MSENLSYNGEGLSQKMGEGKKHRIIWNFDYIFQTLEDIFQRFSCAKNEFSFETIMYSYVEWEGRREYLYMITLTTRTRYFYKSAKHLCLDLPEQIGSRLNLCRTKIIFSCRHETSPCYFCRMLPIWQPLDGQKSGVRSGNSELMFVEAESKQMLQVILNLEYYLRD